MLLYLEKFNNLPVDLRDKVSSPAVMQAISELEAKYGVDLAAVVMRVIVKEIDWTDLAKYFVFEFGLADNIAGALVNELKDKVFATTADYLGITKKEVRETATDNKLDKWLNEKKEETAARSAQFYFSPEDEEEVKTIISKLPVAVSASVPTDDTDAKAEAISNESNLNFSSTVLVNRFKEILKTHLKGVRNKIDTRLALAKDIATGGLSLDEPTIDRIFVVIEKVKSKAESAEPIKPSAKVMLPEEREGILIKSEQLDAILGDKSKVGPNRDYNYDFNYLANLKPAPAAATTSTQTQIETGKDVLINQEAVTPKVNEKYPEPINLKTELATDAPSAKAATGESAATEAMDRKPEAVNLTPLPKKINDFAPLDLSKERETVNNLATSVKGEASEAGVTIETVLNKIKKPLMRQSFPPAGKVKVEDVKFVPKLMGPIDELREMDLTNFRRLDNDPNTRINIIQGKLNFLEEENYARKLAGVKAWRQSPVYQIYLAMGQGSLQEKAAIGQIAEKWKQSGKDYLTIEEFNAVMELNKCLRF